MSPGNLPKKGTRKPDHKMRPKSKMIAPAIVIILPKLLNGSIKLI